MVNRFIQLILLAAFTSLTGCVDWVEDTQDLKKFVSKTKAAPVGKIEPLPEFKPYHSFVYEGASMREPFEPLVPVQVVDTADESANAEMLKPDLERQKEYLETFALDELEMVGTIFKQDEQRLWALIKDSNAEIHRVAEGNYMGLDFGEIVTLDEREIVLLEIIKNGRGGWMQRSRNLALKEQQE